MSWVRLDTTHAHRPKVGRSPKCHPHTPGAWETVPPLRKKLGISTKCQTQGYLVTQQCTPRIYPGDVNIRPHRTECTWLFTAVLLITSKERKLLKSVSADEEDSRKWSAHTMGYDLAMNVTKR